MKKSSFYHTALAFDAPVKGVPVGISPPRFVWKTRMVWLPDGEKISKMFIRFGMIHERDRRTDRRTDRQTSHDGYSITRQKWLKKTWTR